jgi:hypothetical protein
LAASAEEAEGEGILNDGFWMEEGEELMILDFGFWIFEWGSGSGVAACPAGGGEDIPCENRERIEFAGVHRITCHPSTYRSS